MSSARIGFIHRRILIAVLTVVRHPKITLVAALILVAAAGILAKAKLNVSSEQDDLFSPDVPFFRDYLSFVKKFPENEAIYIVVQQAEPGANVPVRRWTSLADEITAKLQAMPDHVKAVDDRVPIDQLGTQGILFDERPRIKQEIEDARGFIRLAKLVGEQPGIAESFLGKTPLARLLSGLNSTAADPATAGFLSLVSESIDKTLHSTGPPTLPDLDSLDASDPSRLGYYYVRNEQHTDRHQLLIRVYPKATYNSLTAISDSVDAIRAAAQDVGRAYSEFKVGMTGRPALEADEMRTTDQDSHKAEVVALIVVFIGMAVMLRSIWLAVVAEISLVFGIGWTFGWATISIGQLNLLSIVFLIALIGIGMDYLVQILTRYRREAQRYIRPEAIWIRVFSNISAPINTACLGAAGAFLVSIFTNFPGTAQLGIIAGGGLLLCLFAGYTVLPALLVLFPPRFKQVNAAERYVHPARTLPAIVRFIPPAVWGLIVVIGIPMALMVRFDPGLLQLQAQNLESVQLVNTLQTWYAVELSKNVDELRKVRDAVSHDPNVASTDSVLDAIDNQAFVQQPANQLPLVNWITPPDVPGGEVPSIADRCRALAEHYNKTAGAEPAVKALQSIAAFIVLPRADIDLIAHRLTLWQTAFIAQIKNSLAKLNPGPLDAGALPQQMRGHYLADDGTYALYIYPSNDLWQREYLESFVDSVQKDVASVSGAAAPTGIAINVYHSTAGLRGSFIHATIYALILVVILVYLDLRKVGETLLAISVLGLGLPMLVAIMGVLGENWNFANFFGLPILIGAGHEYGVFLVHRYKESVVHPRRVWVGWDVSDRALLLCAYVTSSSFGFFWLLGHHLGLKSLGLVMAIGTACIYGASICVLQPILKWRLSRRDTRVPPVS